MTDEKTQHPGIYKRGESFRIAYRVDGRLRRETFRTITEAKKALRQRQAAVDRSDLYLGNGDTFETFARKWVEEYQGRGDGAFSESTRADYRRDLERFAYPRIGRLELPKIRRKHIRELVKWIASHDSTRKDPETGQLRPLSEATIRRALAPVRSVLTEAVMDDLIPHNPCDRVAIPKQAKTGSPQDDRRAMTTAEVGAFLEAIDEHPDIADEWGLFFRLLAATGLRWSEAIALTWGDLTLDGPSLELRVRQAYVRGQLKGPKSRHGLRTIPLSAKIAADLRERWDQALVDDGAIVFQTRTGDYLDHPNTRQRVLKPAAERAGVPWIGFHTFRHTFASVLIAKGRNLKQIQTMMGHHSAAFTLDTYGHLLDEGVGEAIDIDAEMVTVMTSDS